MYPASFADARPVVDHGAGPDPAAVADHDVAGDIGERFHRNIVPDFGVGMDVCQIADHRLLVVFVFNDLGHQDGFACEGFAYTTATPRRMGSMRWISNWSVSPGTTLRLNFTPSIFMK